MTRGRGVLRVGPCGVRRWYRRLAHVPPKRQDSPLPEASPSPTPRDVPAVPQTASPAPGLPSPAAMETPAPSPLSPAASASPGPLPPSASAPEAALAPSPDPATAAPSPAPTPPPSPSPTPGPSPGPDDLPPGAATVPPPPELDYRAPPETVAAFVPDVMPEAEDEGADEEESAEDEGDPDELMPTKSCMRRVTGWETISVGMGKGSVAAGSHRAVTRALLPRCCRACAYSVFGEGPPPPPPPTKVPIASREKAKFCNGDNLVRPFWVHKLLDPRTFLQLPVCSPPPNPTRRAALEGKGTSEAAPEAVRQAVGGGCQSGWGRLLSVTNAIEAGACRQGASGCAEAGRPGGGGGGE